MAAPPAGASAGTSTGLPAAFRTPNVRRVVMGAAVLGVVLGIQTLVLHLATDPLSDVHAYYDAGARLNAGQPLYVQGVGTTEAAFYRYPPLLAILFRPLALLPFEAAAVIWEVTLIGLFTLTILRVGVGRRTWIVLGMLALPTVWSLAIGQAQVAVTFLMALGAPWALALATNLKVLPALAAIWWIGRRDLRSLGWFTVWIAGLALVQLVLEPSGTLAYPSFLGLDQVGEVNNFSLYAVSPVVWAAAVATGSVVAWKLAPTPYGWVAAVGLSVLATPRLLIYQLSTLVAALREPDRPPLRAAQRAGGVDR
jgi:glycosyl transferase family 87